MITFVFPGQGSQQVGMGKALHDAFPYVKALYDTADEALSFSLGALCFAGPQETLTLTQWTQPALLLTSAAATEVLRRELGLLPAIVAGHSLGEYSALWAAGSLTLADAIRLVHLRGQFMQEAVPQGIGAMAAVIGLSDEQVAALCQEASTPEHRCQPANENGASQIVVSGHRSAVERVVELAKKAGSKLTKLLPVSAPFHSALMEPAADRLAAVLAEINLTPPTCDIVANIDGEPYPKPTSAGLIRDRLIRQVAGTVRWERCVRTLERMGASSVIEVGHGRVLCGMIKRIAPTLPLRSFGQPQDLTDIQALVCPRQGDPS